MSAALCVESDKFVRCSPASLDWRYRRWRMIQEILRFSPDIVYLEEVDNPHLLKRLLQSQMEHGILQIVLSRFSFDKVIIAVDKMYKMFDEMRDQCLAVSQFLASLVQMMREL